MDSKGTFSIIRASGEGLGIISILHDCKQLQMVLGICVRLKQNGLLFFVWKC